MDLARSDLVKHFLVTNKLAGWLCWRPDEVVLLAGHQPHRGLSFLLVLPHEENLLFVPDYEPPQQLSGVTTLSYPWGDPAAREPFKILFEMLEEALRQHGISRRDVGYMRHGQRSSPAEAAAEQPALSVDVLDELTHGMRADAELSRHFLNLYLIKTEVEIERIKLANDVAQIGLTAFRDSICVGVSEAELAAEAEYAIARLTGTAGIRSARAWAMVQGGQNTASAGRFNRSSGYRLAEGDLALIELATCVNGYWSDLTVTACAGTPQAEARRLLDAVEAAQRAAIGVIRDGVMAAEVDAAARNSLAAAGLDAFFTHATGHHTGFRYHDPGFPLAEDSVGTLRSGMVLTVEPGAYLRQQGMGARLEHNVAVTESGAWVLSEKTS